MILTTKFRKGTSSGSKLAEALGLKVYTPKLQPKNKSLPLINWGLPRIPWATGPIINKPEGVILSSNKLKTFKALVGIPVPPWTTSKQEASEWFPQKVVCRQKLTGSSGEGIVIATKPEELVDAPLYTLYLKKKWEYRVHVAFNEVIHIQQKRRLSTEELERRGITTRCKYIRNLENGYIFSTALDHSDPAFLTALRNASIGSVALLGLDFGAVDVIVTSNNSIYVLEVNSAPGLEGQTLEKYTNKFKEVL